MQKKNNACVQAMNGSLRTPNKSKDLQGTIKGRDSVIIY